ncbi:MAG: phosphodiester glycosidase family protein [Candidatus Krumholzibacteriia bacterium]
MTRYLRLVIGLLLVIVPVASRAAPWAGLADGLDLGVFETDQGPLTVLRIDPARWQTVALAASALDGRSRTAAEWGQEHGLTAVINAGMYGADLLVHTGYFRTGEHVNNGIWNQRDYRQVACFEPREPGLPLFVLQDLDTVAESSFAHRYDVVVQNLRLIKKPGENRWSPQARRWSEACLGEDADGRMLWIFSRTARSMHDLNRALLDLPLGLVAAQHLEGGPEAQLWVAPAHLDMIGSDETGSVEHDLNRTAWRVPNVLGIRPRD